MKKVNVLLATYNGSKYIKEQICSILRQNYENIDIYIYDDGSSDNTLEIIDEIRNNNRTGKKIIMMHGGFHLGYPECFIYILKECAEADYYAFCDQDDVWLENKINRAVTELNMYNGIPLLFYSAVNYCNKDLEFIRKSRFANRDHSICALSLQKLIVGGEAMGMTYCFNNEAKRGLLDASHSENQFKDIFLKIYCASCGLVLYCSEPLANYRRHEEAVTNNSNPAGKVERYLYAIKDIFVNNETNEHIRKVALYILTHVDELSNSSKKLLLIFSNVNTESQIKKIFWPKRFRKKIF